MFIQAKGILRGDELYQMVCFD